MHIRSGLAFRSPLHARALPNLEGRRPGAMRSVGLDSGTLDTSYQVGEHGSWYNERVFGTVFDRSVPFLYINIALATIK